MNKIEAAKEKFGKLIEEQLARVEKMKQDKEFIDFAKLPVIKIGICGGDGIGPAITAQAQRILEFLLADEVKSGKVEFKVIDGLTIENRIAAGKAIPDDVLAQLKECPVILKGPTTTPRAGDKVNIESANVAMRKELDLFANVRPVRIPEEGIDWTFYRENTEGSYTLGSKGFDIDEDLAFDFTVATTDGTERIIRAAFDYAKKNNKGKVTCVTKANIIKTTDGKFLNMFKEIAKEYPDIETDDWYIDIMTA
ncbi:MAG: isocitrate/isopropylmalate dehydrogenase family protein, partial [Firmicutes bacterium]|nr:isocitrate/isopropylmalate dehydrogenase family protein [Bacillota bacterium]